MTQGTAAGMTASTQTPTGPDAVLPESDEAGIDPARLEVCLGVLAELDELPVDHPDAIAVRRATAGIYRMVKQRRRQERRAAKTANDKAVTEATATGSADRIDDETQGNILTASVTTQIAGILQRPRSCYICKARYEAFGAAGQASKIKKVFNLEEMQKRYDKGELDPKVN